MVERKDELHQLLGTFDSGILVCPGRQGLLTARRVLVGAAEPRGVVWLAAVPGPPLELTQPAPPVLALQRGERVMWCRGRVSRIDDGLRLQALWREAWRDLGSDGVNGLELLRMHVEDAHAWDERGPGAVRFIVRSLDARLVDERRAGRPFEPGSERLS